MDNSNQKTVTYIGIGIIALLIIGMVLIAANNAKNKKGLKNEKLTSQNLLSEKSAIEQELSKLKNDYALLRQMNDDNARLLSESNAKIAENEKRINALSGENRKSKTELSDLNKTKSELEGELARLKSERERLLAESEKLQNSLNSLEEEKKKLASQLTQAQLYDADNFLVTATRGKKTEKIVICASRAKKLNMAFEVPLDLSETISFKIVTPTGSTVSADDKNLSWSFPSDSRDYTASLSPVTGEFEQSRQVVLNYAAKEKLVKGEYKIQILSNGNDLGNCRILLK